MLLKINQIAQCTPDEWNAISWLNESTTLMQSKPSAMKADDVLCPKSCKFQSFCMDLDFYQNHLVSWWSVPEWNHKNPAWTHMHRENNLKRQL